MVINNALVKLCQFIAVLQCSHTYYLKSAMVHQGVLEATHDDGGGDNICDQNWSLVVLAKNNHHHQWLAGLLLEVFKDAVVICDNGCKGGSLIQSLKLTIGHKIS